MITFLVGVACGVVLHRYGPAAWAYLNKKAPQ